MRVIQNKKDMISYYQLQKNWKKVAEAQKIGQNCQKMRKFDKKLVLYAF